ncbi:hypothetical protein BVRB_3g051320 isoform A [Beta vulgaris subsp. vulgaris]|uniref:protein yippee-like At4g27740 n=1 Tax=Beta vulgaris subsp. vulgaris TaxID=3555 RepID=UPI00053F35C5|nr:protein yippee-like At4g27740 [Beta vulgaris subsp. vulgaris]KMT15948.1 hypothetical protein BVRB_3g051320 isoform A [Beta vulgaris subsp. vulgaris]
MTNSVDLPVYSCNNCWNPVAFKEDLLSKAFVALSGQAFMFRNAMNLKVGDKVEKQLMTGQFTVADIYCGKCGQVLGWKYFRAHDPRQAYKEGNYIIECAKIVNAK